MTLSVKPERFKFAPELTEGIAGKRVLITGSGKDGGLGQAFALACGLNGAESVGVHFFRSYNDGLETVDMIEEHGGSAFPLQADVTNTSDLWASRTYVINRMGGKPPNVLICNSGLSETGYVLGRPPRPVEDEPPARRRARARRAFVDNLEESTRVVNTKMDGFLYMTHLWAGEALHFSEPLQIIYISSRQAVDPGAGVPGYVLANFGVLSLPKILRKNLGRKSSLVRAFSVAYPFVRTGMTDQYADNEKVFGRWQPRMLETSEASLALISLLGRPPEELDDRVFQLNVDPGQAAGGIDVTWSEIELEPQESKLPWSFEAPLQFGDAGRDRD